MFYFRFKIPAMADGSPVTYSPGWCGTRDQCACNEKSLYYNDRELWGLGQAEGDFVPPDVEVVDEKTALEILATAKDEDGVFFGEKLDNRWLPETVKEDFVEASEKVQAESTSEKVAVDTFARFCPICHKTVCYVVTYQDGSVKVVQDGKAVVDGIKAAALYLTCPSGHKVKVSTDGR